MSAYAKLSTSDVEAAPIPTLHDLQAECELGKLPVESTGPAPVASKTSEVSTTATATATAMIVSIPAPAAGRGQSGYGVQNCCCGCSLPTGIRIMSYLDCLHAISFFIMAGWFLWLKVNEGQVDTMIENQIEAEQAEQDVAADTTTVDTETEVETEAEVDTVDSEKLINQINKMIDVQACLVPIYLFLGAVIMFYACKGFKAAAGDVTAATSYLQYRRALVIFTAVTAIFSTGFVGAVFQVIFVYYLMVVVRSHLNNLISAQTDSATASVVVIS